MARRAADAAQLWHDGRCQTAGTQFTCFTGTKVQILTQKAVALLGLDSAAAAAAGVWGRVEGNGGSGGGEGGLSRSGGGGGSRSGGGGKLLGLEDVQAFVGARGVAAEFIRWCYGC
jgi:uncharacterized membrane protein YgcG